MGKRKGAVILVWGLLTFLLISSPAWAAIPPNTITFDNQSGVSALVKVEGPTFTTVLVPNGSQRIVNLAAGNYVIKVRYGNGPNDYRYEKGDPFTVEQTATQYTEISMTLHKVVAGNSHSEGISADDF